MTAELGPRETTAGHSSRPAAARALSQHWGEATGAHLLIVDPLGDTAQLRDDLGARGVHVTWVASTLDGLVEFGRTNPNAVVVAPDAGGVPAHEFVAKVCEYGSAIVIAAVDETGAADAGRLLFAGAGAAVTRPYDAETVWEVLQRFSHALGDHARVEFGPIELDARAYTVRIDGERIPDLPLKEFELLRSLMYRAPGVLSDEALRESLWGSEVGGPTDNTIAVHAARLRGRLQGVARVRRIRGRGYSLTLV